MKKRLISAGVGLVLLFTVFYFFQSLFVVEGAVALLAAIAVYELLKNTKLVDSPWLIWPSVGVAALFPFAIAVHPAAVILLCVGYFFYLCLMLLVDHDRIEFSQIAVCLFGTALIALGFSSWIVFRDMGNQHGVFYVIVALASAWLPDTGGYFVGRKWGRHAMAPKISPKKTVEGLAGGMVSALVGMLLLGWIYSLLAPVLFGEEVRIRYGLLAFISLWLAVFGVLGDLFASVIKRQTGIKDYGRIMPGHGGVLDRFDSALWTMSAFALFLLFTEGMPRLALILPA